MTDKKLTDSEIVNALSKVRYGGHGCKNCKYDNGKGDDRCGLKGCKIARYALDLITRQQAENENLKVENQSLRSAANSLKMHYEEAWAEIESLKIFRGYAEKRASDYRTMRDKYLTVKSEAYKEFAGRIKEFMHNKFKALDEYEFEYITERDIDNIVKEMAGDDNA